MAILAAMDDGKKINFTYESKNKKDGAKKYSLTPKWWLSGCTLRLFQAGEDGEGKRFHVCDIKGEVSIADD